MTSYDSWLQPGQRTIMRQHELARWIVGVWAKKYFGFSQVNLKIKFLIFDFLQVLLCQELNMHVIKVLLNNLSLPFLIQASKLRVLL